MGLHHRVESGEERVRNRARNPLIFPESTGNQESPRLLQWEDPGSRPDRVYQQQFLREAVERCVTALPEHHRVIFVLREMEGRTYEAIAEMTGCRLGTVKSRLNRARHSFAQAVAPFLD